MKKAGIIGSGIAGIASSIHLARKGYQVTVFEQAPTYGGKLGVAEIKGYRFDLGPSLFTMPHYVTQLLDKDLQKEFEVKRLNTLCHYFYEHRDLPFKAPASQDDFIRLAADYFQENPKKIETFLKHSKKVYDITAPVFLENSLHRLSTYTALSGLKGILNLWQINLFQTMNQALEKQFSSADIIQLFNRYATYNGSNPYQAPATLNVISHLEFFYGAYLPQKGMRAIVDILFEQSQRLGVHYEFNNGITNAQIGTNHQIKSLIDSNQHEHLIDIAIANIDAKLCYRNILKKEPPKRIVKAENSSSALIFYWGIGKKYPELDVHNILFSQDYPNEFDAIFHQKELQKDPTVYINITSKEIPEDAPKHGENWFVMINAAHDQGQYSEAYLEQAKQLIIDKINRVLKTDIRPYIEVERILDPVRIASRTGSDKGSLYGSSSNDRMSAFFRQANQSSDHKNLYFCGGSVHPGGGIPLCLLGASILNKIIPDANR